MERPFEHEPASHASAATPTGAATMSPVMAEMRHYPRYLFNQIAPFLGRRIVEIGVGFGTYTPWLLERGEVFAADTDEECLGHVRDRFACDRLHVERLDLGDPQGLEGCAAFRADSVVCINVLEHIADDAAALRGLYGIVEPGGALCLIVPAHPALFGRMDAEAGHHRRYTRASVRELLTATGWRVESCRYVNALGAAGWWVHNRLRTTAGLHDRAANCQIRCSDRWLPLVARFTDPLLGRLCGLSVLAVGRRDENGT
jgi:SAM-dependent methyltransferase